MALITELTVVNECIAALGEAPMTSLASPNPMVASARFKFSQTTLQVQSRGWYFNTEQVKIIPQVDNMYYLSADVLGLSSRGNPHWLTRRGTRLYSLNDGKYLEGSAPFPLCITRLIPFDDLPYQAQDFIKWQTVADFCLAFDADQLKLRKAEDQRDSAYILLNTEHIKAQNANMLSSGPVGYNKLVAAMPIYPLRQGR